MRPTPAAAPPNVEVVFCEAVFDIDAAARAWERIVRSDPSADVMLDFSGTRVMHDAAFAALIDSVSQLGRRVRTRGMARHQEALRRYMERPLTN